MPPSSARTDFVARLQAAAAADRRLVAILDYGSGGRGEADVWSDLDLDVFIADQSYDAFVAGWRDWAARLGNLLLAYIGHHGHTWTVYDADPIPLRVDFDFHRASAIERVSSWPYSFISRAAAVLHDTEDGRLAACVRPLIGRSLAPADPHAAFDQVCGDFWYFILFTHGKLHRGERHLARQTFHAEVMEPLYRLLRLEAGAVERWRAAPGALGVERVLPPERLTAIDGCVPGAGAAELARALHAAATLGLSVCAALSDRHGWPWPEELARRAVTLTEAG